MAGAFFVFSAFIMQALRRLPASQAIAAMQSINVSAVTPLFMTALFGTAAACVLTAVSSLVMWQEAGAGYVLIGSLCYVVGTVGVTIVFNVPRNDILAAVNSASADSPGVWAEYVSAWTWWNHVRTAAALAAGALMLVGVCLRWLY